MALCCTKSNNQPPTPLPLPSLSINIQTSYLEPLFQSQPQSVLESIVGTPWGTRNACYYSIFVCQWVNNNAPKLIPVLWFSNTNLNSSIISLKKLLHFSAVRWIKNNSIFLFSFALIPCILHTAWDCGRHWEHAKIFVLLRSNFNSHPFAELLSLLSAVTKNPLHTYLPSQSSVPETPWPSEKSKTVTGEVNKETSKPKENFASKDEVLDSQSVTGDRSVVNSLEYRTETIPTLMPPRTYITSTGNTCM